MTIFIIGIACLLGGSSLTHDAVYSITLYWNHKGYHGERQNWSKDHWVRALRLLWGLSFIAMGIILLGG